jgi:hypothetical protein
MELNSRFSRHDDSSEIMISIPDPDFFLKKAQALEEAWAL